MLHVSALDRFQDRASLIHSLDPRVKVVVTLVFIVSNVLLPDGAWSAFFGAWGITLLISALSRLGYGYALKRSFIALPFALAAVSVIVALPGRPLFALQLGPLDLVATEPGLIRFVSIVIRSWISVQMAILLTATTQFPDLMHALRHLRVPRVLIAVIALMYRYLFVLADEALRLLRAREARSARPARGGGGGSVRWRARVAGNLAGQLFLRSYERSDRVYLAMVSRGYDGRILTLRAHVMTRRDWLLAAAGLGLIAAVQTIGQLGRL